MIFRFRFNRPLRLALVAVLLVSTAAINHFRERTEIQKGETAIRREAMPLPRVSGDPAAREARVTRSVEPVRPAPAFSREPQAPPARQLEASAAVQQILPEIKHLVTDWREFKPQTLTIAPYPDLPMAFEATSIREENGRTIWTGRNTIEGAFLVAAATEQDWYATLVIPQASTYEFHIAGEAVTLTEKNQDLEYCGNDWTTAAAPTWEPSVLKANPAQFVAEGTEHEVHTVDVLFFYDAETVARAGNDPTQIETLIITHLEACNQLLENSEIADLRWRYLDAHQVPPYETNDKMDNDLDHLVRLSTETSGFVFEKAIIAGADQIVFYIGGARDSVGVATAPPGFFSVVAWGVSYMVLGHEMSHNYGCRHDRQTEEATDGDGLYHYAHRFTDWADRDVGTVMAYSDFRAPYFSNPEVILGDYVMGVPEDQPKAAYNARILRDGAEAMAARAAPMTVPVIVSQPKSVTVNRSQGFDLEVAATGEWLLYRWRKDGTLIPEATDPQYTVASAGDNDAGAYTVEVANLLGSLVSEPALVTVSVPAPPPPPPSPSSGGGGSGGGGGSIGGWSALGLVLLPLLRRFCR